MVNALQYTLALVVVSLIVAGCTDSSTDNKQTITDDKDPNYRGSWAHEPR